MTRNMHAVFIRLLLDNYLNYKEYVQHGVLVSQISSKPLAALNRAV